MILLDHNITIADLADMLDRFWSLSGQKILAIDAKYAKNEGATVYTVGGKYTSRGWTQWTEGFVYGSALLQFDATGDEQFWVIGTKHTLERMPNHLTSTGVHDHGFNNISTYGNILRLINEGRAESSGFEDVCKLALRISGAVQATRWTDTQDGLGYIYSFNGAHSLFVDTLRSLRSLAVSHALGQTLLGEQDVRINLLHRLIAHALTTARYSIYYDEGRDIYDVRGRTAHESLFNPANGAYRCPSTQQGYSPFSTWTRGLAWAILGFTELVEFLMTVNSEEFEIFGGKTTIVEELMRAARVTADYYVSTAHTDGIPVWDTGAPGLLAMGDWQSRPSDPFNLYEPVDSSAAAIAAQGLWRLSNLLKSTNPMESRHYSQSAMVVTKSVLEAPYLSVLPDHEGLLLHSVYHRPNGWDHIPTGQCVPCGESSMWGDYHVRELALMVQRMSKNESYYTFFEQKNPAPK